MIDRLIGSVLWRQLPFAVLLCILIGCQASSDAIPEGEPSIASEKTPALPSLRIINAVLLDGTGAPATPGQLRIQGSRILEIGNDLEPRPGEEVFDAQGKVLAPGFIDTHSHVDDGLLQEPDALAAVSQGITTVVVGQDGEAPFPLAEFFSALESSPAAIHLASYVGHGTLRYRIMGLEERHATPEEVAQMNQLLRQEMESGALGLSTGLEYEPGMYSSTDELIELARVTAQAGGRYISHLRSEDRHFWAAVDELITIGEEAKIPVQISHLKLAMRRHWGQASELLHRLDQARARGIEVSADLYPYTYWQSSMTVLFPAGDFDNAQTARFVLREIVPADRLLIPQFDPRPELTGKTLAEIARAESQDPATLLLDLVQEAAAFPADSNQVHESVIATSMDERDVAKLMTWSHANFCTDGELRDSHPRGFGTMSRILGRYVRELGVLTLPEAIQRMTGLAAQHMGFSDRGLLREGMAADLVLFDPETVSDRSTLESPHSLSTGIERVWVHGQVVFENGQTTGRYPGTVLRRRKASEAK